MFLIGDGCGEAAEAILKLAQMTGALFVTTPDGKGFVNPRHPSYRGVFGFGGHASADALLRGEPDLVVAFGTGFGEFSSAGWCKSVLNSRLVHVGSSDDNLMRSPMARLHVHGRIHSVCARLIELMADTGASNVYPFRDRKTEQTQVEAMMSEPHKFHSEATPIKPQRLMKPAGCSAAGQMSIGAAPVSCRSRAPIADYATLDLTLRTTQRRNHWDFAVSVRNLFNADAREPSLINGGIPNDLPLARRALYAQATYGF